MLPEQNAVLKIAPRDMLKCKNFALKSSRVISPYNMILNIVDGAF